MAAVKDRIATTGQVWMGLTVGCAQCHDHPYDSWTRQQFFSIAAHTAGSRVDANRYGMSRALALDLRRAVDKETPQTRNVMRGLSLLLYTHVKPGAQPSLPLPDDYQYPDAKPGTRIVAAPMWSEDPLPPTAGGDPRIAWAAWITDDRNPRFAAIRSTSSPTVRTGPILVTGGSGFIGRYVVQRLAQGVNGLHL